MLACLDVDYRAARAITACLVFDDWTADRALHEIVVSRAEIASYVPGEFYKRELPCLMDALARVELPLDAIVVDGHVWLGEGRRGLGAHLHDALDGKTPVVGVAKRGFYSLAASDVVEVKRGRSDSPLYVTAAGLDVRIAAERVRAMHGAHRLPTLLKRVDRVARDHRDRD